MGANRTIMKNVLEPFCSFYVASQNVLDGSSRTKAEHIGTLTVLSVLNRSKHEGNPLFLSRTVLEQRM